MKPCIGAGLGLRFPHIKQVIQNKPKIPWFELHICNFLNSKLNKSLLEKIAQQYPLSFHGVNLNFGGVEPLNNQYLSTLKDYIDEFQPNLVSEHLCFTAYEGRYFHDLLPIPYTEDALKHIADRILQVQDILQREIMIENISRYYNYEESIMSEAEFSVQLCDKTDCKILLDINNLYVNSCNLDVNIQSELDAIPSKYVGEIHLAGFSETADGSLIDTHSKPVSDNVWRWFTYYIKRDPNIPCLIEWDSEIPEFSELNNQREIAQSIIDSAQQPAHHAFV